MFYVFLCVVSLFCSRFDDSRKAKHIGKTALQELNINVDYCYCCSSSKHSMKPREALQIFTDFGSLIRGEGKGFYCVGVFEPYELWSCTGHTATWPRGDTSAWMAEWSLLLTWGTGQVVRWQPISRNFPWSNFSAGDSCAEGDRSQWQWQWKYRQLTMVAWPSHWLLGNSHDHQHSPNWGFKAMATMVRMVLLQLLRLGANSVRLLRKTMPQVFWNHKLKVQNNQFQKQLKVHLCGSYLVQVNAIARESPSDGGRCYWWSLPRQKHGKNRWWNPKENWRVRHWHVDGSKRGVWMVSMQLMKRFFEKSHRQDRCLEYIKTWASNSERVIKQF